jgi:hypothetical protein
VNNTQVPLTGSISVFYEGEEGKSPSDYSSIVENNNNKTVTTKLTWIELYKEKKMYNHNFSYTVGSVTMGNNHSLASAYKGSYCAIEGAAKGTVSRLCLLLLFLSSHFSFSSSLAVRSHSLIIHSFIN